MSQLKVNSIVPVAGVPTGGGGGIIQIVQTIKTDEFSTTNDDAFNDITGITATITPTSTSSKVFIIVCMTINVGTNSNIIFRLLRGSTAIGNSTVTDNSPQALGISGGKYDSLRGSPTTFVFLDSPSTTSPTTYKVQELHNAGTFKLNHAASDGGTNTNQFSGSSTITLMEVSA